MDLPGQLPVKRSAAAVAGALVSAAIYVWTESFRVQGGVFGGRPEDNWKMAVAIAGPVVFAGLYTFWLTRRWPRLRSRVLVPGVTLTSFYLGILLLGALMALGGPLRDWLQIPLTSVVFFAFGLVLAGPALATGAAVFAVFDWLSTRRVPPEEPAPAPEGVHE